MTTELNLQRAITLALRGWQAAGVTHVARAVEVVAVASQPTSSRAPFQASTTGQSDDARPKRNPEIKASTVDPLTSSTAPPSTVEASVGRTMNRAEQTAALEVIRSEVVACTRCRELAAGRTQTVFGVGNPAARLVFVGEAPGADEDRLGEPFVGRAGQLLTKIIEACTLSRQDVYILNVLKCRPPGNRTPLPDEVESCRGFLERQLDAIRPEFICCLGAVATRALLDLNAPMNRIRGKFYNYRGSAVICTYHPSYLLRNPAAKKDVWEDMKLLMARMGINLGK